MRPLFALVSAVSAHVDQSFWGMPDLDAKEVLRDSESQRYLAHALSGFIQLMVTYVGGLHVLVLHLEDESSSAL